MISFFFQHFTELIVLLSATILSFTKAGVVPIAPAVAHIDNYDPHPQYSFAYNVHDTITGDAKSQHESRNGDVVTGHYSLIEADGSRRLVEYTADPINGFNAIVHREPALLNVQPVIPKVASTFVDTPLISYHH